MNKITFINGETPINDTNLNNLQNNIENAINLEINSGTQYEIETNKSVDGKRVYMKRINIGKLPNNNVIGKRIYEDMSEVEVIDIRGIAKNHGRFIPLPYVTSVSEETISIQVYSGIIYVSTNMDRTNYTAYVDVYYTKNE